MPGEEIEKHVFINPSSDLTIGNTKINFSTQIILVYLQLVSEGVRILGAGHTVGGGQRLLALLGVPQLGQHGLQAGLEGMNLLQT